MGQILKSMNEEKRMVDALIEMNTTLTRNCSYLSQVAQAMQIHLRDLHRAKTIDGAMSDKNANTTTPVNALQQQQAQAQPQIHHTPQPTIGQIQMHQPQQTVMQAQQFVPQQ